MTDSGPGRYREANLVHYWQILWKRWPTVATLAGVVFVTVFVGTLVMTEYYSATATLEINPKAPMILPVEDAGELVSVRTNDERHAYYATQYRILRSRTLLLATIDVLREQHGITDFDDEENPVRTFRKILDIRPEGDTELVHITIIYPDADKASLFANTLAHSYMDSNLQRARDDSNLARTRLLEQKELYNKRRLDAEEEVHNYVYENGLLGVDNERTAIQEGEKKLQNQLAQAQTERLLVQSDVERLKQMYWSEDWLGLANHIAQQDEGLATGIGELQKLRQTRQELLTTRREGHPDVVAIGQEITGQEELVRAQLMEYIEGREAKLSLLKNREREVTKELGVVNTELELLNRKFLHLQALQGQVEKLDDFYKTLDQRLAQIEIVNDIRANNVHFVDRAWSNWDPIRPKMTTNLPIALLVGVMAGVGLAFLQEYLDSTVKSRDDIEKDVGIPFLGAVPLVDPAELEAMPSEFERNLFVHGRPRSPTTEALRSIRTNILFRSKDRPLRRLLVTSAAPQEGKSFISSNLAAVIAMTGTRVLLIDCDLRRPTQHKLFVRDNGLGLTGVLDGLPLEEAVWETPIPNLDLLVAGPHPANPAELLGSQKMLDLLDSITGYDMVVIDSPPVSAVADPLILSRMVDGVVMAVRSNQTHKNQVIHSRSRLSEMEANILGAIVNRLDVRRSGYGYYYYYDYNTVYYADAEADRDTKAS
ncbi:MAG TPA: polysaccharide biosynthesis tyrosine autokinase [Myxococcota bacterium]|nr:polysaccharide biosynthesis tyrosine autokinase [Myxococcota bacterium]